VISGRTGWAGGGRHYRDLDVLPSDEWRL